MKTIFKYRIRITDEQAVSMPEGAQILTVQMQDRLPYLWAIVDTNAVNHDRVIEVLGTGNPIPKTGSRAYIGTVQERPYVWHVFERLP